MDHSRPTCALIGLLAVTAALYAALWWAPFVYQDAGYLSAAPVWTLPGRGLAMWTWMLTGHDAGLAHLVNLALHLLNGALLYALLRRLVPQASLALIAAGIFLLHPLSSEAIAYVTGRADVLITTGALLATWAVIVWTDQGGLWRVGLCALGLIGAALSKEIGFVAALLCVLTLSLWRGNHPAASLARAGVGIGAGVVIGASWWRMATWIGVAPESGGSALSWPAFAWLQLGAVWDRLVRVVFLRGFTVDPDALALSEGWRIGAAVATVALVALAVIAWRRVPLLTWALMWLGVCLLPRFVFAGQEFVKEYQLYPAMVGVSVVGAVALQALLEWIDELRLSGVSEVRDASREGEPRRRVRRGGGAVSGAAASA